MRGVSGVSGSGEAKAAAGETFALVKRYVVQETVGPFKHIARRLAFGLAGSLVLGVGVVVLLLGLLRVLEGETGSAFRGNWSFAPYLLSALVALVATGAVGWIGFTSASRKRRHATGVGGPSADVGSSSGVGSSPSERGAAS